MVWRIYSESEGLLVIYAGGARGTALRARATPEQLFLALSSDHPGRLPMESEPVGAHVPDEVKAYLRGEGDWVAADLATVAAIAVRATGAEGRER